MKTEKVLVMMDILNRNLFILFLFAMLNFSVYSDTTMLKRASDAYNSIPAEHRQELVFAEGDYVFFNVSVDFQEEDTIEREGELMMARFLAVRKYICNEFEKARLTVSPFGEIMAKFVVPDFEFEMDNVAFYTIFDNMDNGKCTRVYAFEKDKINVLKKHIHEQLEAMKAWNDLQWSKLLNESYMSMKSTEDKEKFFIFLGCPILNSLTNGRIVFNGMKDEISAKAWQELTDFVNIDISSSEFFSAKQNCLWKLVWGTKGCLHFFQPKQLDDAKFNEAKTLYKQGKNLPRIIELLTSSIEQIPNHADKWRYLGGSLMVQGKYPEALVVYIQAAKIDPLNIDTLSKIGELCEKCGFPVNSKGVKWYVNMLKNQIKENWN